MTFNIRKRRLRDFNYDVSIFPGLGGGGGVGNSNIKKVGVLVVSLRGVNFRLWSRLGC